MNWFLDRLKEDSTRSALGQLGLLIVLVALLCGVDVKALVTEAQATMGSVTALIGAGLTAYAQVSRMMTPEPRAAAATIIAGELLPMQPAQTDPGLVASIADEVARRLAQATAQTAPPAGGGPIAGVLGAVLCGVMLAACTPAPARSVDGLLCVARVAAAIQALPDGTEAQHAIAAAAVLTEPDCVEAMRAPRS